MPLGNISQISERPSASPQLMWLAAFALLASGCGPEDDKVQVEDIQPEIGLSELVTAGQNVMKYLGIDRDQMVDQDRVLPADLAAITGRLGLESVQCDTGFISPDGVGVMLSLALENGEYLWAMVSLPNDKLAVLAPYLDGAPSTINYEALERSGAHDGLGYTDALMAALEDMAISPDDLKVSFVQAGANTRGQETPFVSLEQLSDKCRVYVREGKGAEVVTSDLGEECAVLGAPTADEVCAVLDTHFDGGQTISDGERCDDFHISR